MLERLERDWVKRSAPFARCVHLAAHHADGLAEEAGQTDGLCRPMMLPSPFAGDAASEE